MRAGLEQRLQIVVHQVVVDVAQLVMDGGELFLGRLDALLDPHVALHVQIPGAGVADHVAVARLGEHGFFVERRRQLRQADGGEEVFGGAGHALGTVVLRIQRAADVQIVALAGVGFHQRIDVAPLLGPHIAQQVGGDGAVFRHDVAVLAAQAVAHIAMQRFIQRLDLTPKPLGFGLEFDRAHVVTRPPHLAQITEAQFAGACVGQFHEAHVVLAHGFGDGTPAGPHVQQRIGIAARGNNPFQFRQGLAAVGAVRAVLAGAVSGLHPRGDGRQLFALGRVRWRRHRGAQLQHQHAARGFGVQLQIIETLGGLDLLAVEGQPGFGGLGGQQLGVFCDVGIGHPVRGVQLRRNPLDLLVDIRHEGLGFGHRRR